MNRSSIIKLVLAIGIISSILVTYYVKIVQEDYTIFWSESGLPDLEE